MTSSQIKSVGETPQKHKGGRKGAKHSRPGRNIDPAKQAARDRIATHLKGYLGVEGFISVRERGERLSFVVNGEEVASAYAGQVDCGRKADKTTKLDVKGSNGLYATVLAADMISKSGTAGDPYQGARKKCWVVKSMDADGRETYKPAGIAFVNGVVKELNESAARKCVALWVAGAMTPNSARKEGKRVKANIRTKDGKGTRYIFRLNGNDLAAYYHNGTFETLVGGDAMTFEEYLRSAGIPCANNADGAKRIAKLTATMLSPEFASDIDEQAKFYDDEETLKLATAEAARQRLIPQGVPIEEYYLANWKEGQNPKLIRIVEDVQPQFGGDSPSAKGSRPRTGRKAGKRSAAARPKGSAGSSARFAAALSA